MNRNGATQLRRPRSSPPTKRTRLHESRRERVDDLHRRKILFRKPTRKFRSSITACSMATASSKAFAFTTAASFGWKNIWSGCGIRPARSASRFRCRSREMTEALLETIRQNDLREGYIRLIVTRGVGNLGLNPAQCKRPSVIIIASTIALYPEEVYQNGLTVVTVRDAADGPGDAQSRDQVAQLSEQRDGADRGEPGQRRRSVDVERRRQRRRVHRGQCFHHQARADLYAADHGRRLARDHAFGRFRDRGRARDQDHRDRR